MPYWLSLLADLLARDDRPMPPERPSTPPSPPAQAHDDVWWLPEVMRMRAAHDDEQAAVARLRSAAQLASAHGSARAAPALRA